MVDCTLIRLTRVWVTQVCLTAFVVSGCAAPRDIRRQSVDELYREAVKASHDHNAELLSCDEVPLNEMESFEQFGPYEQHSEMLSDEFIPIDLGETSVSRSVLDVASNGSSKVNSVSFQQALPDSKLISELFEQTDIREAIQILAAYSDKSVVIDDSIGGVTSAHIQNEPFDQALQKILMPLGLEYAVHDGSYIIAPPDPDSPLFRYVSFRTTYAPRFHKATELLALLPPRMSQFYQVSDNRNLVVIDAPKVASEEILTRLRELDQPVQQVELEAIVCVSAPDRGFRFGVDWNHVAQVDGLESLNFGLSGLTFSGKGSPQSAGNAFSDFAVTSAFIKLLAQEGYVSIRAAPRVTTKDNEKATISIARETFFSLQPSNSNVLFRQDVQKVEAGISLDITPRIRGNRVSVQISKAEVSEDIRSNETASNLSLSPYPIINRRTVTTNVDVNDGQTIVIGGLVQRQTVDRVNRVPFFGSLPVVGNLFRTIEQQEQEAEVAIFISPKIVALEVCE